MNVVIISWEMLETGGINRVIGGFQTGLIKLGHNVITYHASKNGRLKLSTEEYTLMTKWYRPKSVNLGWYNSEQLKDYRQSVKKADFVLSVHGCPHPTNSGAKGDYGWHKLYEIPRKYNIPIGIVFTDNLWDRLYSWIVDIITPDTKLFYNNFNAGYDSIPKLPNEATFIDYPIDLNEQILSHNKNIDVAWLPQWKKWKGIYEVVEQISKAPNRFSTAFFNSGIEYYNLRKTSHWRRAINTDYFINKQHNKNSKANYYGIFTPDRVHNIYSRSKVSLDLSGAYAKKFEAQFTCAMAESMMYKSLMVVSPHLVADERSRIRNLPIVYPARTDDLVNSLYEAVYNDTLRNVIIDNAYTWVKDNCLDMDVTQKIINYMKE